MAGRPERAILAIDTSGDEVALALGRGDEVSAERSIAPEPGGRPRHATELLPAIEAMLEASGGWSRVEAIAVGAGPGSYTGLRVGIATARALAQARRIGLVAVPSLDVLDRGLARSPGCVGRLRLCAFDARRGEAFAQLRGDAAEPAWGPAVAGPEQLAELLAGARSPVRAVGSGALRFRDRLEAAGAEVPPDESAEHRIAARHLCALADGARPGGPEAVRPIYLRRPDAELWRERDGGTRAGG